MARLSSLCSFRTLYFTPESGPATEGFSCRGAVMNDEGNAARKIRKLRASRDLWKQCSAEKQQEIRQLRVTVRDLSSSRENWKTRVKELDQQLQAAHEAHAAVGPGSWIFFGGLMDNQAMPRTGAGRPSPCPATDYPGRVGLRQRACLPPAVGSFGPDLGLRGSYQLSRHRLDLCLPPGRGGSRRPLCRNHSPVAVACRLVSPASALAALFGLGVPCRSDHPIGNA